MNGFTQSLFRIDSTVGFDRHHQLIEVGTLSHTSSANFVGHAADRAKGSIHDDTTDRGLGVVVTESAHITGLITAALFNLNLHVKLTVDSQVSNHVIRVNNGHVMRQIEVGSRHNTFRILMQRQRDFITAFKLEDNALQIQKNVNNVF